MKISKIIPFSFSAIFLALTGCGGESAKIIETPNRGVATSVNGCSATDSRCQTFIIDYPVDGINFNCSSDITNQFVTKLEGNDSSGGCLVGDKINFFIQGAESGNKIELGTVDLKEILPYPVVGKTAIIGLSDIAKGMSGKAIVSQTMTDETYKVLVRLIQIFQAIGIQKEGYVVKDVQPIYLTTSFKNDLKKIDKSVNYSDFLDGTFITDLAPWFNINGVTEIDADVVAKQLINLSNVAMYTAEYLSFLSIVNSDILGFQGQSQTNVSINNLYALTTRQGYTLGYSLQWIGNLQNLDGANDFSKKLDLIVKVAPTKLTTYRQSGAGSSSLYDIKDWINPLNGKILSPMSLKENTAPNTDLLEIYQGTLVQDVIPGTEEFYKRRFSTTKGAASPSDYGKWRQNKSGELFTGTVDIFKSNPATYLNREVFITKNNTKAGDAYIFPLYANLIFSFSDASISPISVGIVIDEHGDIRTNRSATSLVSTQCLDVDNALVDTDGVQQYRIGTTGAVNSEASDKSITLRMILSNPIFGDLDGALIGINAPASSATSNAGVVVDGVRLNLQNLIADKSTTRGINITGWIENTTKTAEWANIYAYYFGNYNAKVGVTGSNPDYNKIRSGTLGVSLPNCYSVKTK